MDDPNGTYGKLNLTQIHSIGKIEANEARVYIVEMVMTE